MPNHVRILTVPDADRAKLERRARDRGAPARVVERARIVLLSAEGLTGPQIAGRAGCSEPTVVKWRRQYAEDGLAGLEDAPRPGGPKTVMTDEVISEVLAATVTPPPQALRDQGITHWSARRLAGWRAGRRRSGSATTASPGFGVGSACSRTGVRGSSSLPTRPWTPGSATWSASTSILLGMPSSSALAKSPSARPWNDPSRSCRCATESPSARPHDYARHGVTSLFAALNIATGHVTDACYRKHRHQ